MPANLVCNRKLPFSPPPRFRSLNSYRSPPLTSPRPLDRRGRRRRGRPRVAPPLASGRRCRAVRSKKRRRRRERPGRQARASSSFRPRRRSWGRRSYCCCWKTTGGMIRPWLGEARQCDARRSRWTRVSWLRDHYCRCSPEPVGPTGVEDLLLCCCCCCGCCCCWTTTTLSRR